MVEINKKIHGKIRMFTKNSSETATNTCSRRTNTYNLQIKSLFVHANMGDNNKANDNIFMHIFSPYEKQNSERY